MIKASIKKLKLKVCQALPGSVLYFFRRDNPAMYTYASVAFCLVVALVFDPATPMGLAAADHGQDPSGSSTEFTSSCGSSSYPSSAVVAVGSVSGVTSEALAISVAPTGAADGVTVDSRSIPAYDRSEWLPSWADEDGDGEDTRVEVLDQESLTEVARASTGSHKVVSGRWVCPYTGVVYDSASYLDIEHVVPLKEAHVSGGWAWPTAKKRRYSNYLGMRSHLQVVGRSSNRSKGDKRPDQWLPPYKQYRCAYVRDWYEIKRSWGLSMVASEKRFVDSVITACSR